MFGEYPTDPLPLESERLIYIVPQLGGEGGTHVRWVAVRPGVGAAGGVLKCVVHIFNRVFGYFTLMVNPISFQSTPS